MRPTYVLFFYHTHRATHSFECSGVRTLLPSEYTDQQLIETFPAALLFGGQSLDDLLNLAELDEFWSISGQLNLYPPIKWAALP